MMGSSYTETLMINATRSVTNTTRFTNYAHYLSYITKEKIDTLIHVNKLIFYTQLGYFILKYSCILFSVSQ